MISMAEKYTELKSTTKVGVLMGGLSKERDISLATGQAVINALSTKGWNVIGIDVDRKVCERIQKERIDIAFVALHGKLGEDGTIQGMLELMGIPYTGSGVLASSLAINKVMAKMIFKGFRIPTPDFIIMDENSEKVEHNPFGYPVVVKPCTQGSTIGIHMVQKESELSVAIKNAFRYDSKVFLEEFIPGREITVGILGLEALPVIEVITKSGFYDFRSKYSSGETEYLCPAPIQDCLTLKAQELGLKAHNAMGCRDFSRVDFRLGKDDTFYCLEVNSIPGMTNMSLLPKAAKQKGIEFPDLTERILSFALARNEKIDG